MTDFRSAKATPANYLKRVDVVVGIVVGTHGDLADGLLSAAALILGNSVGAVALGLIEGMAPEAYGTELSKLAQTVDDGNGVIFLTDLRGGTPFNQACLCARYSGSPVLSGVNLPMVIQSLTSAKLTDKHQLAAELEEAAKRGIKAFSVRK